MSGGPEPRRRLPVFVARQTYRRRRLVDAARVLPVLGLLLWMLPLLWGLQGAPPRSSQALIYIFGVWVVLILACAMLLAALRRHREDGGDDA